MTVTIKTDHKWRDLVYRHDVPAKVLKDQFEHLYEEGDEIQDGFFCYRDWWYHVSDFMSVNNNADLAGWDGYASDSYFSGVVIKLSKDSEQIKIGRYFS